MKSFSVIPNKVFKWSKGLCLKAVERIIITLPPHLVGLDQKIGDVLLFSNDDTFVEYTYSEGYKNTTGLRIDLKKNNSLTILKDTEAIVASGSDEAIVFEVIEAS